MKTVIKRLKLGVLLTGLVVISSCSNPASVGSSLGVNVICRTIPAVATTVGKYSERKIAEYLKNYSQTGKGNKLSEKKVEKSGGNPKSKPVSISVSREAPLI